MELAKPNRSASSIVAAFAPSSVPKEKDEALTLLCSPRSRKRSRMAMLRKLYRLDGAARRMRVRVLTVIFAAALAIVIAMMILGH